MIKVRRIYGQADKEDGFRILVDRLWPREMSKEKARIDLWLKEIASSDALRNWFSHDPEKWEKFKKKYEIELKRKEELIHRIKRAEKEKSTVTLPYSAKDEEHNQAVALSFSRKPRLLSLPRSFSVRLPINPNRKRQGYRQICDVNWCF